MYESWFKQCHLKGEGPVLVSYSPLTVQKLSKDHPNQHHYKSLLSIQVLLGLDRAVDARGRRGAAHPVALPAVIPHTPTFLLLQVLRPRRSRRVQTRHIGCVVCCATVTIWVGLHGCRKSTILL